MAEIKTEYETVLSKTLWEELRQENAIVGDKGEPAICLNESELQEVVERVRKEEREKLEWTKTHYHDGDEFYKDKEPSDVK